MKKITLLIIGVLIGFMSLVEIANFIMGGASKLSWQTYFKLTAGAIPILIVIFWKDYVKTGLYIFSPLLIFMSVMNLLGLSPCAPEPAWYSIIKILAGIIALIITRKK